MRNPARVRDTGTMLNDRKSRMRVGVMDSALAARPTVDSLTRANYMSAVANRVDSFWVPDHLNALFPRSIWAPKYSGAARLAPRADASMEPWTMLGHLAARNRLARLRLGVSVTDTGRRSGFRSTTVSRQMARDLDRCPRPAHVACYRALRGCLVPGLPAPT